MLFELAAVVSALDLVVKLEHEWFSGECAPFILMQSSN